MATQPPKKPPVTRGEQVNLVAAVAQVYANWLLPFIRTQEGRNAYGSTAWLTLFLMLFFGQRLPAIAFLIPPWAVLVLWKRMFPSSQHSRFTGLPWLGMLVCKRLRNALLVEMAVILLAGVLIGQVSPPAGLLVKATSAALGIVFLAQAITMQEDRARLRDAGIEMRQQAILNAGRDLW